MMETSKPTLLLFSSLFFTLGCKRFYYSTYVHTYGRRCRHILSFKTADGEAGEGAGGREGGREEDRERERIRQACRYYTVIIM